MPMTDQQGGHAVHLGNNWQSSSVIALEIRERREGRREGEREAGGGRGHLLVDSLQRLLDWAGLMIATQMPCAYSVSAYTHAG